MNFSRSSLQFGHALFLAFTVFCVASASLELAEIIAHFVDWWTHWNYLFWAAIAGIVGFSISVETGIVLTTFALIIGLLISSKFSHLDESDRRPISRELAAISVAMLALTAYYAFRWEALLPENGDEIPVKNIIIYFYLPIMLLYLIINAYREIDLRMQAVLCAGILIIFVSFALYVSPNTSGHDVAAMFALIPLVFVLLDEASSPRLVQILYCFVIIALSNETLLLITHLIGK